MMVQALFCLLLVAGLSQQQAPSAPALATAPAAAAGSEQQSFRINGIVVDAMSGQPLARAQVSISAQGVRDSGQSAVTDEDGRFVFENLPAGHYGLFARRKGYLQQFYKQHEQFSTAIIVGPELNTEDLRFEMRPDASIAGQGLDEVDEPGRQGDVLQLPPR